MFAITKILTSESCQVNTAIPCRECFPIVVIVLKPYVRKGKGKAAREGKHTETAKLGEHF